MTLVLVGHGSRDPRSAAALHRLAERVRGLLPGVDVRLAFLELSVPSVEQVLGGLSGDAILVPLLLGKAFHATVDIPERLRNARASVVVTDPIGSQAAFTDALAERAGDSADGWVLAGTGSSHRSANAELHHRARTLTARLGRPVRAAFVTAEPGIEDAVAQLRAAGCATIGLLPWFLAPGLLLDRAEQAAGIDVVALEMMVLRVSAPM